MTPEAIGSLIQTFGPLFTLVGLVVTGGFMIRAEQLRRTARQDQTPESVNEATRIGMDGLTELLKESREERKELRAAISELNEKDAAQRLVIDKLRELDTKKTRQIEALERRAILAAGKLRAGLPLTVADILGPETEVQSGLGDVEDTVTTQ